MAKTVEEAKKTECTTEFPGEMRRINGSRTGRKRGIPPEEPQPQRTTAVNAARRRRSDRTRRNVRSALRREILSRAPYSLW